MADLPPGFRFYPSDEELVVHFLYRKASHLPCTPDIIPDLGLYQYDPWELNGKALAGGNQWYFFSHRTQNRVTANGYWKSVGIDEPVTSASKRVGMKKSLAFYVGEAPTGTKTNWIMHEFHLLDCGTSSGASKRRANRKTASNKWVLCRVYEMNCGSQASFCDDGTELSCLDERCRKARVLVIGWDGNVGKVEPMKHCALMQALHHLCCHQKKLIRVRNLHVLRTHLNLNCFHHDHDKPTKMDNRNLEIENLISVLKRPYDSKTLETWLKSMKPARMGVKIKD